MQIDWLTVAAQIVNFLVLVWLLKRFLYRPITAAMARREERIESRLAQASAARAEAEAEARRLREERENLAASRERALREARQQAADLRKQMEDDLRNEMEARRKTWHDQLEEERAAFTARLRQSAGHQVIGITERVLRDYAGSTLAGRLAGSFAGRLAGLDAAARDKLKAAAGRADGPVRVDSSMPLSPAARREITRAIHARIAPDIEVDYGEDDDLLLGIRLTIGEQTLEWSAARYLDRLESAYDEAVEGGGRHPAREAAQ